MERVTLRIIRILSKSFIMLHKGAKFVKGQKVNRVDSECRYQSKILFATVQQYTNRPYELDRLTRASYNLEVEPFQGDCIPSRIVLVGDLECLLLSICVQHLTLPYKNRCLNSTKFYELPLID